MTATIGVCALSDTGRVRTENQDAFVVNGMVDQQALELRLEQDGLCFDRFGLLCAVADGMGGHRGGAEASRVVLETLALNMPELSNLTDVQQASAFFRRRIRDLHVKLQERGRREAQSAGMGTTLVGVYLRPDYGVCFHAGDSRLYRYRRGSLMQMTSDHSPEVMMRSGTMYPPQRLRSGTVVNCIGGRSGECMLEVTDLSIRDDDVLLLCSDGLSDMLDLRSMEESLQRAEDLAGAAAALVASARAAGGRDNITAALIEKRRSSWCRIRAGFRTRRLRNSPMV